ncbi:hypothetical protein VNO80_33036 [Phaseolus coccineus]|uniref:Uncharacterized protein n=1 Tax=Phaseolus coccineus TaxID=3886 RepID=A0AAN9L0F3_PHACN
MHRIRENCPATCAALPVHGCEDRADHVRDFRILRNLHRVVEAQTETLFCQQTRMPFANNNILITTHTPSRSQDPTPRDGPPPTRRWQVGQMETSSDPVSASLGMEKNIRVALRAQTSLPVLTRPKIKPFPSGTRQYPGRSQARHDGPLPANGEKHTPDFVLTSVEISHTPKPTSVPQLHITFSRTRLKVGRNRHRPPEPAPPWVTPPKLVDQPCNGRCDLLSPQSKHNVRGDA